MPRRTKTSLDYQKPLVMAMKLDSLLLAVLFIIGFALTNAKKSPVIPSRYSTTSLNRTSFPKGFIFGSASSAYQVSHMPFICVLYLSIFNTYTDVIIVYYSMKVHGIKVVENQAFGTTTPTSIQVPPPQMHPESKLYVFYTSDILLLTNLNAKEGDLD